METYQFSLGGFLNNKNKKKTGLYLFTITMAKFCVGQEGKEGRKERRRKRERNVERTCHEPGHRFLLTILTHLKKYYYSHLQMKQLRLQLANK